jgi:hypothetical protein
MTNNEKEKDENIKMYNPNKQNQKAYINKDLDVRIKSIIINHNKLECVIDNKSDKILSYVELDIFQHDNNNKIIMSEYTNWSGTLPPNASTKIKTFTNFNADTKKYSIKISEIIEK